MKQSRIPCNLSFGMLHIEDMYLWVIVVKLRNMELALTPSKGLVDNLGTVGWLNLQPSQALVFFWDSMYVFFFPVVFWAVPSHSTSYHIILTPLCSHALNICLNGFALWPHKKHVNRNW